MSDQEYIPHQYWNEVAKKIRLRGNNNFVAGDDKPFYRYKRQKFLSMLISIPFKGKKVLEIGCGPGGNLLEIVNQGPAVLYGVDIAEGMIGLSLENTAGKNIHVLKTDGKELPFENKFFDIIVTATVLQHVTDEKTMTALIDDMCRVAATDIYIFERIEKERKLSPSNTGRTLEEYTALFEQNGFELEATRFAHIHTSYLMAGMSRKLFDRGQRAEGDKQSKMTVGVQQFFLPLTKQLDKIVKINKDLAMLHFKKRGQSV